MKKLNSKYVESIVKKAADGKIASRDAAAKLGVSRQYLNRLKKAYGERGAAAFEHGNKGKSREWKANRETEKMVIELYSGKYAGFNFAHFLEKLNEDEGIAIGYRPLYRILSSAGFASPKKHRAKRERAKHPSRPRKERFGELLQIDASIHNWFGPEHPKATLHGAIIDRLVHHSTIVKITGRSYRIKDKFDQADEPTSPREPLGVQDGAPKKRGRPSKIKYE